MKLSSFLLGNLTGAGAYYYLVKEPLDRRTALVKREIIDIHRNIPGANKLPEIEVAAPSFPRENDIHARIREMWNSGVLSSRKGLLDNFYETPEGQEPSLFLEKKKQASDKVREIKSSVDEFTQSAHDEVAGRVSEVRATVDETVERIRSLPVRAREAMDGAVDDALKALQFWK